MWQEWVQHDKELFLFLNNLGTPGWDGFWMFITDKLSAIPVYLVLLILFLKQFGLKRTIIMVVTVAIMILVTDQLSNFFKYGIQRLRPCYDPEIKNFVRLVKDSCGGKFGYFSAHAANTFAVAFFFTILIKYKFRYLGVFLMLWAGMVSYSRIYIGVHFPLDVITGALVGLIFSWLFAKLYIFALEKNPV
ncbi:MAG: phosphatase PAP2 family protein [Pricia sp.]|nr:phosphatase PAP2 family protein [Pricia sp.]